MIRTFDCKICGAWGYNTPISKIRGCNHFAVGRPKYKSKAIVQMTIAIAMSTRVGTILKRTEDRMDTIRDLIKKRNCKITCKVE